MACENNIPAIYAEYLGGAQCSPQGVVDYVDGCLNVLGMLEMIERDAPESRVDTVVEDQRKAQVICRFVTRLRLMDC